MPVRFLRSSPGVRAVAWLLVPAALMNGYFRYRTYAQSAAYDAYSRRVTIDALAHLDGQNIQRGDLYGGLEAFENLITWDVPPPEGTPSIHDLKTSVRQLGGVEFELSAHRCPRGACYAGDDVFSGSIVVRTPNGPEVLAEVSSVGAKDAAEYRLHFSHRSYLDAALAAADACEKLQAVRKIAASSSADQAFFRALLEAWIAAPESSAADELLVALLGRIGGDQPAAAAGVDRS